MDRRVSAVATRVPAPALLSEARAVRPGAPVGPELPLTAEVRGLVARSAGLRRGLAFVHRAPPECVASALGVTVRLVEYARACLERGPERVLLIQEYAGARDRRRRQPPGSVARPPPPRRGPDDLARDAERHPLGVQFLLCAPFETVAITFGVHPDVVLAARDLLAARGVRPEASAAEP
jgi:hypothetical protein